MIPLPKIFKTIKKINKNTEVFEIEPLYPGYGTTIGNALRRVLLSSLEGAGITLVKIKGVSHEYSTIPGVIEDVITIILNLQKIRFRSFSEEPIKIKLSKKGKGEVRAGDFKVPPQLEIVNPKTLIATLTTNKANLEIEAQVEKGIGYEPEERRKRKLQIGEIGVDTLFSPVKRVAFHVGNIRVGERTDFDKLTIEIETDETITPKEALIKATEILIEHFSLIKSNFSKETPKIESGKEVKEKKDLREIPIEDLSLSKRTLNALLSNKISNVKDIEKIGKEGLTKIKGLGKTGIKEIEKKLKKIGIKI